jgi:Kef-type K+ transport system membrane component KefB/nucleotide-binding universal stress UspA family protein
MERPSDTTTLIFIVQLGLLMVVGRSMGELMQRVRQPAVMGQLIGGVLLGPSVLGAIWPTAYHAVFPQQREMLKAVSELGIVMLLLLTGMEIDLGLVKHARRATLSVSLTGILVPFTCGFLLGEFLPNALLPDPTRRLATALFLGTALSISSVKIVAAVIRELDFTRRTIGQIILGTAMLDDTVGWIIVAVIASIAARGTVSLTKVGVAVLGTAAFLAVSFTVGKKFVTFIIRWSNDHLVIEKPVITAILALTFGASVLTDLIGVHAVLGAFVSGIVIGQTPILTRHIQDQLSGLIVALFMPVFFAAAGLGMDLTILKNPALAGLVVGFILIAGVGKLVGAYIGGRLGGLTTREAGVIAIGMNARGSTDVIIATIGLSLAVLTRNLFTMIVVMAIVTTLVMPPTLRWALGRLPLTDEERKRLERERGDASDFVPGLERVLIAVDRSANGQFASRLAGLFVGSRQIMTTVLAVGGQLTGGQGSADPPPADIVRTTAEAAAAKAAAQTGGQDAARGPVSVAGQEVDRTPEAVLREAKKGYDFLFVGIARPLGLHASGVPFDPAIEHIAKTFEGAIGIVIGNGEDLRKPLDAPLDILVPVSGTDYSRRAAEVALAIGAAAHAQVTALYVSSRPRALFWLGHGHGPDPREVEILNDITRLAGRQGVNLAELLTARAAPEDAIAHEIRKGKHTLVVLGVKTRPGDRLYFGHVATALQEHSLCSLLLVSS